MVRNGNHTAAEVLEEQGFAEGWSLGSGRGTRECWWGMGDYRGPSTALGFRLAPLRMTHR